ncbi:saccharopine dehydrogenase family protein [Paenibacillus macerans]|uniref:saccharopine dehydrogenase family protein n=1 Tax=Paenibacillus macerans TaxID=44252 RepID=UPI003D321961
MDRSTAKIVILGGYGTTGQMVAELLLRHTSVQLVLAGRNRQKADAAAAELNLRFGGTRVTGRFADAADSDSLKLLFDDANLAVVASSSSQHAREVAISAMETETDVLDIQYSAHKMQVLRSLEPQIKDAGRCFITDGGFHPGLAAVLVHAAAAQFDALETANVGSVIKIDWPRLQLGEATVQELAAELKDFDTTYFTQGQWKKGGLRRFDFGPPFGKSFCSAMMLEEMRLLPDRYPGLKDTGFFVGGFNPFVDWVVMPLGMVAFKLFPNRSLRSVSRLMGWGLVKFSKPPYGTILKVEASGTKNGHVQTLEMTVYHEDGYWLTAIPVVACLLQYLDGSIRRSGLWTQANLVQPDRLLKDMQKMGVVLHPR